MAITTVNPRYEGFIFDGENSRDYGIYVQSVKVFGAPTRDVEMVSIPGRDGEFVLDKGRFNNIQVVYTCALGTDTQTDFNTGVSDFRNWLASRKGYKRLEDEINTTEYRMAVFKDGLDVSTLNKETGTFEVTFDCKPQRFLKSGEIPRTIGGSVTNPQTKSGTVVSIDSDGGDKAVSLVATIEAVQAGSGDPSPTNVRAITGWTAANVTVAGKNLISFKSLLDKWGSGYTDLGDGSYNVTSAGTGYREPFRFASKDIDVTLSGEITQLSGSVGWRLQLLNSSGEVVAALGSGSTTLSGKGCKLRLNYSTGGTGANYKNIQVELGTTATAYEPYTGTTTTTALGRTVYGGTLDVVTGVLTVTHEAVDLGTLNWTKGTDATGVFFRSSIAGIKSPTSQSAVVNAICTNYKAASVNNVVDNSFACSTNGTTFFVRDLRYTDAAAFKTAVSGVFLVYELATPQSYNLTAQQVELLAGQNNVWADTGDISITYGHDPNKLVNPTLFDSHPLLEVDGYGTISISGEEVVLHNEPLGIVLLGGGGSYKNSLTYHFDQTQFNTGDFITVPGYRRTYQFDMVKPYGSGEITDFQMTSKTAADYIFSATKYQGTLTLLTDASVFTVGTARTDTYNVVGQFFFNDRSGIASIYDVELTTSVIYDGTGAIRFRASVSYAENNDMKISSVAGNAPTFYGDSTWQPVTDTAYIDLDIGEAYVIQGGSVIGINNIVDLPAELPTLKAGANAVTFDNTITKLVILPRWWKV